MSKEAAPTQVISVRGQEFEIPVKFLTGQKVSAAEADLINSAIARATKQAVLDGNVNSRPEGLAFSQTAHALAYKRLVETGDLEDLT